MPYRVVIVEEEPELLKDMQQVFHRSPDFEIAATYTTAASALGQAGMFAPNLFMIDLDSDSLSETVPAFRQIFPDAILLGTFEEWDGVFAKQAVDAGANGCIQKPFTADELLDHLRLYARRGKVKPATLISFFSPKGRAGRTTLAALLALLIAEKTSERVALIDGDLQFGDLPIFFDVEPKRTVVDAAQDIRLLNPVTFESYFHPIKDKVALLASPDRPEYAELVSPEALTEVVLLSENIFRYVLVDLPAGFNPLALNICRISDHVFIMTMINSGFEVTHAKKTLDMFATQADVRRAVHSVFTRVQPFNDEQRNKIAAQLTYPVDFMIPNEYKMISVANSGRLAYGLPKESLIMQSVEGIADQITRKGA